METKLDVQKNYSKIPLTVVATAVQKTMEAYEDGVYDDTALDEIIGDLLADLKNSVDRRISLLDFLGTESSNQKAGTGLIGKAEELYKEYKVKMQRLVGIREKVKEKTLAIIEQNPSVSFEGNLGRFASQKNGQSKLNINLLEGSKHISHLVTDDMISFFSIDPKFVREISMKQLDTDAIKKALEEGEELPWANLEKGTHLRIRR